MYNIKGPSQIVAKTTRRGISQSIDNYRDQNRNKVAEDNENITKNVPRPVFQKKNPPNQCRQESIITPQHVELIKFIHESWTSVYSELEGSPRTVRYFKDEPCESLQEFRPFDLESWWGKRLYAHITSTDILKN